MGGVVAEAPAPILAVVSVPRALASQATAAMPTSRTPRKHGAPQSIAQGWVKKLSLASKRRHPTADLDPITAMGTPTGGVVHKARASDNEENLGHAAPRP